MKLLPVVKQLKKDEGFRAHPYRCSAGRLTIGYGWNLQDRGITKQEAEKILIDQVGEIYLGLAELFPWFEDLDEVRQGVLVNMGFQLGIKGLMGFRKALAAAAAGRFDECADEMKNSKWAKADTPARAGRLAAVMRAGAW